MRSSCLRYAVAATLSDPDHYVTFSEWRDQAAVDAHYAAPAFTTFQMALDGLLARPTETTIYDVSATLRPLPSGPIPGTPTEWLRPSRCSIATRRSRA